MQGAGVWQKRDMDIKRQQATPVVLELLCVFPAFMSISGCDTYYDSQVEGNWVTIYGISLGVTC